MLKLIWEELSSSLLELWMVLPRLELGRHLLKIDLIRYILVKIRLKIFLSNGGKFTLLKDGEYIRTDICGDKHSADYNLESLQGDLSSARSSRLIRPLSCIEQHHPKSLNNRTLGIMSDIDTLSSSKVLCIGPRNEAEIFLLYAYGFDLNNIEAIDLISYGNLIKSGDMHNLPYVDSTFDIVICSCTLPYSSNPKLACGEFSRVLKERGTCALMIDVPNSKYKAETIAQYGYPLYSPNDMLDLFSDFVDIEDVFWKHFPAQMVNKENGVTSSVIFQIIKSNEKKKDVKRF